MMECDSKYQYFRYKTSSTSISNCHVQSLFKVYWIDYPSWTFFLMECLILETHMIGSQITTHNLKLPSPQFSFVKTKRSSYVGKKKRLSTAASIFPVIQLLKRFSPLLAFKLPTFWLFPKFKSRAHIYLNALVLLTLVFVTWITLSYSLTLCRWEHYPMIRIPIIEMLKEYPWDFYLQNRGFCLTCLGMSYWIEVRAVQITFQTFFSHWIKGGQFQLLSLLLVRNLESSPVLEWSYCYSHDFCEGTNPLSHPPELLSCSQHDSTLN